MSQADLEERSGIPKTMLSRYENNHVRPSFESLARLASSLGVPESILMNGDYSIGDLLHEALRSRGVEIRPAEVEKIADLVVQSMKRRRPR